MYTEHYSNKLEIPKSRWAFPEKCHLSEQYQCAFPYEFAKPLSEDCHVHDRVPFKSTADVKKCIEETS